MMSHGYFFEWHKRFSEHRKEVEDDELVTPRPQGKVNPWEALGINTSKKCSIVNWS